MDFEKKLKSRLEIAVGYILIGVILVVLNLAKIIENEYLETLGIAFALMGALRIIQYKRITKNEETIKSREIAEKDERNISIMHKAKSMAFGLYILITGVVVIVLEAMGRRENASILALNVCGLVLLYWICYFIYNRKL